MFASQRQRKTYHSVVNKRIVYSMGRRCLTFAWRVCAYGRHTSFIPFISNRATLHSMDTRYTYGRQGGRQGTMYCVRPHVTSDKLNLSLLPIVHCVHFVLENPRQNNGASPWGMSAKRENIELNCVRYLRSTCRLGCTHNDYSVTGLTHLWMTNTAIPHYNVPCNHI